MRLTPIQRLKAWRPNQRVCVTDDQGKQPPLLATLIAIDPDYSGFTVKWDHNCGVGWQPVEDIVYFDAA